jgi:hypothetical protein
MEKCTYRATWYRRKIRDWTAAPEVYRLDALEEIETRRWTSKYGNRIGWVTALVRQYNATEFGVFGSDKGGRFFVFDRVVLCCCRVMSRTVGYRASTSYYK